MAKYPDIACCKVTGVWSLQYIETKGMFSAGYIM